MKSGARDAAYVAYRREEQMRELRNVGYGNSQIAHKLGISIYKVSKAIGKNPRIKRKNFTITCSPEAYNKVRDISKELGLVLRTGNTSGEGSVGHLVEAIAAGVVHVTRTDALKDPDEWLYLPDIEGEVGNPRIGDGQAGEDAERPLQ